MRGVASEEPQWLAAFRQDSAARFESLGYPTKRLEAWRYTSVRPIARGKWPAAEKAETPMDSGVKASVQLFFVNGHLQASRAAALDGGSVSTLSEAQGVSVKKWSDALADMSGMESEAFVAMNGRDLVDAAFVEIGKGVELAEPIELVFMTTEAVTTHPRVIISAAANSRAKVVERYVGCTEDAYFTNSVVQVRLDDGACVEHIRLQEEGMAAYHVGFTSVRLGKASSYDSHVFSLGATSGRSEIHVAFEGEGASCRLNGLYAPWAGQSHDNYTLIDHAVPNCTSEEFYKAIVNEKGTGSFQGRVCIRKYAVGSSSDQLNRNLLLGDGAVANTKPQLEIDNDDVRATHGSTVGQLDQEAVFYLMARGLRRSEARAFLVRAFAYDVIDRVSIESLRTELREAFDRRLASIGASE